MSLTLPEEGSGDWDAPLNTVLRTLDRRTDRIYTPWQYGAVGDPDDEIDDTDAINEAVEAAQANDGLLFLNGRFGFAGEVFLKGGVPVWASGTARFGSPAGPEPGLVALDGAAQVQWGKFSDGSGSLNDNPGPIYNLVVDGQHVGGASGGLFRAEAVQVTAYDLQVMNSVGDGLHLASSQNVNFVNLQSHGHEDGAGVRIRARAAGAQPPGHCVFFGGHIGDCWVPIHQDSHDDTFFVGPHDNVFYGPIIETGRLPGLGILTCVLVEDGNLALVNPTITIGAEVTDIQESASVVLRNVIRPAQSTVLTIQDPNGIGGGAGAVKVDDLVRIEQAGGAFNEVRITGVPSFANANEAAVCFDGGAALYSCDARPRFITAGFDHMRAINGGDLTGVYQRSNTPRRIEVPADSSVSALGIREDGKAANAVQVSKTGEVRFLDPDTGATRATLSPVAGGGLLLNGVTGGQGLHLHVAHYADEAALPAASGLPFRLVLQEDTDTLLFSDGADWQPVAAAGAIAASTVTADDSGMTELTGDDVQELLEAIDAYLASLSSGDGWTYQRLAADYTNDTVALTDVFAGFAPAASTAYEVEVRGLVTTSDATAGFQSGFNGPTGSTQFGQKITTPSSATADIIGNPVGFGGFSAAGSTPASANGSVYQAYSQMKFGGAPGAGNVRLQARSETAGQTVKMLAGSYMRWRELS